MRDDEKQLIHGHVFDEGSRAAERGTRMVTAITALMMVVEIVAGWWFNSMALLADGWHMSSHTVAIGLSAVAYAVARRHAEDPRFAFGTWKVEVLGGFASAVFLLCVAAIMAMSSIERIFSPQTIRYEEAIAVAVAGLAVNLVCAWILGFARGKDGHPHGDSRTGAMTHAHGHAHGHAGAPVRQVHAHVDVAGHVHDAAPGDDLNLKSAYLHVVADAATSVLAIVALIGGWLLGWSWLDPAMGILGAVLVANWARNLVAETGAVLLDREMDHPVVKEILDAVQGDGGDTRVTDIHVWRVGRAAYACAVTVLTSERSLTPAQVRERLAVHEEIAHSTIEVHYRDK